VRSKSRRHVPPGTLTIIAKMGIYFRMTTQGATQEDADLVPVLTALADPIRLAVVRSLATGARRSGELAEAAGVTAPTMSKHLRVLLDAGIVAGERVAEDARVRMFRLRPEALQASFDQLQALWNEQLRSFKKHVEAKRQ
jgi:DNA-binding transcriptional ArsR family regulator